MSITSLDRLWYRRDGRIRGCYVYMLFCGEGQGASYIKVGLTETPEQRLDSLRTSSPMQIEMFATVEVPSRRWARRLERDLHEALDGWNTRGEWFRVMDEDRPAFIKAWKKVFARHERPSWPLIWACLDMTEYERIKAARKRFMVRRVMRRGRAYRDYLRDSVSSGTR